MDMGEVRSEIASQLNRLGYTVVDNPESGIRMGATMDSANHMEWSIKGAGQKSFEVEVRGDVRDLFGIEAHHDPDHALPWFAFARFKRGNGGIRNFLDWLSTVHRTNHHLVESLNPGQLPQPLGFRDIEFELVQGYTQGGQILRAKIDGMVMFDGTSVILTDVSRPGAKPWFVGNLQLQAGKASIITDGDYWYPIVTMRSKQRRVLMAHGMIVVLKLMGLRDRSLIQAAIQTFARELVG